MRSLVSVSLGLSVLVMAVAVGILAIFGGEVAAPEPARLNATVPQSTSSTASATYTNSYRDTIAIQWPGSWTRGTVPPGLPCATTAMLAGTTLDFVILANGNYRKCGGSSQGSSPVPITRPEAAKLETSFASGNPARAVWTKSAVQTYAYLLPTSWIRSNAPPGLPCATFLAPTGAVLTSIVIAAGNYRKCQ